MTTLVGCSPVHPDGINILVAFLEVFRFFFPFQLLLCNNGHKIITSFTNC